MRVFVWDDLKNKIIHIDCCVNVLESIKPVSFFDRGKMKQINCSWLKNSEGSVLRPDRRIKKIWVPKNRVETAHSFTCTKISCVGYITKYIKTVQDQLMLYSVPNMTTPNCLVEPDNLSGLPSCNGIYVAFGGYRHHETELDRLLRNYCWSSSWERGE